MTVEYLPGQENTLADALSREERPRTVTPVEIPNPDISLASGDVEAGAPHVQEREGTRVPEKRERDQDSVGVSTPT